MNLLRTLATVSGMTMLSRITGLVREILMAQLFGATAQADAFYIAFRIPNLLRRLSAEGAFSQAFVPILGEFKTRHGEAAAKQLVDRTATVLFWALLAITVVGIIAAPVLVWLMASGIERQGGDFSTAVLLTRVMFPYILLVSLVAAASGILNTWRQFAVPAFTPVLLNVSFIAAALWLTRWIVPPVLALGVGVVVGGILQLAIQIPPLRRIGMLPTIGRSPREALKFPAVQRVLRQMVPATMAVSVAQISLIINTNIAAWLGTGTVSWITYADRLMEFPTALLGAALGTILTPSLSHAMANDDQKQYGMLLDWGMRLCFLLALPCAVGLWLIGTPITATLFNRGAFTAHDVEMTRQAVLAYGVGLTGLIMVKILAPGFYARQDIRTPVKIAILVLLVTQLLNLVFVPWLRQGGLALSTSLGATLNAVLLYRGLRRKTGLQLQPGWWTFLFRLAAGLVSLSLVLILLRNDFDWLGLRAHPWIRAADLGLVIGAAALAYLATLLACGLRLSEFRRRI